ncbi:MAG: SulP family inorganic anion transporter [Hyphomicrobiales bacterium]
MRVTAASLKGDIFGGITAAVVALPLALAFGVASGVGPIAGLYGAIAVGFFAAIFGGTPAQVSGPTGPMTVVMGAVVAEHAGNLGEAFTIVILGGVFQMALGFLRVGRYVSYTPFSVVSGFMSGIGVIIIIIQTLPFLGMPAATGGPLGAIAAWGGIPAQINVNATLIACLSLAVMIWWPARLKAVLPPPLAALILGTLVGIFLLPGAPVIGEVPTGLPSLHLPVFSANVLQMIQPAFILALLGSIDSLLTSLVADSITRTRHNSNRELIGQGFGNLVAGLIGGIPGAGATMRTVINVRAGGRTPISGALHALVLLALVLGLGPLAERIPHAVLAGILMKVGWDIIDWGYLKRAGRAPREKVVVMLVTLVLTVFVDLITAVAIGLILANFVTAEWMEREELKGITHIALPEHAPHLSEAERDMLARFNGSIGLIFLRGRFSHFSAREMVQRARGVGFGYKAIVYDFAEAAHVDTSAALAIDEMLQMARDEAMQAYLVGLSGAAEATLRSLGVLEKIPADHIVPTLLDALSLAGKELELT